MLTHLVCFDFDDWDVARAARDRLLSMRGRIPSLLDISAGLDVTHSERSYKLGLVTRHADPAGLLAYQEHPVHLEVAAYIRAHATRSVAVDFQTPDPT